MVSAVGSTTSLSVSWAAPANAGKPAIASYDVQYRWAAPGPGAGPVDVTARTITSLVANTDFAPPTPRATPAGPTRPAPAGPTTNNAPTAANNTVTTAAGTAYAFTADDFGFVDTDSDMLASVKIVTVPAEGTLALGSTAVTVDDVVTKAQIDGSMLTFTPVAGASGTGYASFTFKVNDGTDDSGSAYTMTIDVTAVNTPATGAPTITGTAQVGRTLTAVTTGIADANGLTSPTYTYQWIRVNGSDADIAAANSSTYTLVDADLGKTIKVKVSFTDDASNSEMRTSAATATVTAAITVSYVPLGYEVTEGVGSIDLRISVTSHPTAGTPQAFEVLLSTADGTATAADDYVVVSGQLIQFGVGDVSKDHSISIIDDSVAESDEAFTSTLSIGSGQPAVIDTRTDFGATATITINDDDTANTAPTSADEYVEADEDMDYTFSSADFLFTDTDTDTGDSLASVKIVTLPASGKGTLTLSGTAIGSGDLPKTVPAAEIDDLKYSPPANLYGIDFASFTFKVNDGTVDSDDAYTMYIDVQGMDDPATGKPGITGTAQVGRTLTATVGTIADVDGLPDPFISAGLTTIQWIQVDGVNETDISGATSETYTLATADEGKKIKVKVWFQDDDGTAKGPLTSDAYPSSGTVTAAPVTNTAPTGADNTVTTGEDRAYAFEADDFRFDDADAGDTLASVTIVTPPALGTLALDGTAVMADDVVTKAQIDGDMLTFTPARDAHGDPYTTFTFKVNDGTVDSASAYTMTIDVTDAPAPVCAVPDIAGDGRRQIWSGTVTVERFEGSGFFSYGFAEGLGGTLLPSQSFFIGSNSYVIDSIAVPPSGNLHFSLEGFSALTSKEGGALRLHVCDGDYDFIASSASENTTTWLATTLDWSPPVESRTVYLSLPANNAATGEPTISGTAQVGQELTADASPIMDTDGLPSSFTYQWVRVDADGMSNPADITDATDATYTLTAADAGKKIKVQVSFVDILGGEETRTSAASVTVPGTNTAPVFSSSSVSREIAENTAAGVDVGAAVTATDADAGDNLSYTLGGADVASFDFVETTGQIRTKAGVSYDFEAKASYTVTVTATDNSNATAVADVTISITDVDEPPSAPATPMVSAVSGSTTSLSVSWAAPANAGKPAIASYDVQYRVGSSGAWSDGPVDVTTTSTTIASLVADTLYEARVRASNAEGDSGWSDPPGSGRTNAPTTSVPGAPGNLRTAPGDGRMTLTWTAPGNDGGAAIEKYRYRVRADGGSSWDPDWTDVPDGPDTGDSAADETTFTVSGLSNGTEYVFQLRAVNSVGEGRAASATGTPVRAPLPPGSGFLVGNFGQPGDDVAQIFVTQDIVGVFTTGARGAELHNIEFRLFSRLPDIAQLPSATLYRASVTDSRATRGARVAALTAVAGSPRPAATAQTVAFAAPGGTRLEAGATYLVVLEEFSYVRVESTTFPAEDAGGAPGWAIDGIGAGNNSPYSYQTTASLLMRVNGTAAGAPVATAPDAPASLGAAAGDARVRLAWTPPRSDGGAGIEKYQVRYSAGSRVDPDTAWTDVPDGSDSGTSRADERSVSVTELDNGRQYAFELRAVNGVRAGAAATATATPAAARRTGFPVSNFGQPVDGSSQISVTQDIVGAFTAGALGATLDSIEFRLYSRTPDIAQLPSATLYRGSVTATRATPGTRVATLTAAPGSPRPAASAQTIVFTAPGGTRLEARATYLVVLAGSGFVRVEHTNSSAQDAGGASGWSIDGVGAGNSSPYSYGTSGSLLMSVNGTTASRSARCRRWRTPRKRSRRNRRSRCPGRHATVSEAYTRRSNRPGRGAGPARQSDALLEPDREADQPVHEQPPRRSKGLEAVTISACAGAGPTDHACDRRDRFRCSTAPGAEDGAWPMDLWRFRCWTARSRARARSR